MTADDLLGRLKGVHKNGKGWTALCPAHEDRNPSLSMGLGKDGRILLKCFAGCPTEKIVAAIDIGLKDLYPFPPTDSPVRRETVKPVPSPGASARRATVSPPRDSHLKSEAPGLTLAALAEAKRLPVEFLKGLAIGDSRREGSPVVRIPYFGQDGEVPCVRYRLALQGARRFAWRSGDKVSLYGLLEAASGPEVEAAPEDIEEPGTRG